jgi:peptidoglycan/xylan/chitin deacetylase (PgdA/CDA1 family)
MRRLLPLRYFGRSELQINSLSRYQIRDDFTDDRAAGSVSTTSVNPGPGTTRYVRDAESKLSLASGKATISGGKASPAYNDPCLVVYPGQTRTPGRIAIFSGTHASGNRHGFGWFDTATPSAGGLSGWENILYTTTTLSMSASADGASPDVPVTLPFRVVNRNYQYAIALRSAGAYYFVRGHENTRWLLAIDFIKGSAATVYAGTFNYDAAYTSDFICVPSRLFLPVPYFYDTFTRSNGAIGSTETSGPDGQALTAKAWPGTTWTVSSNAAINTPTLGAEQASGNLVVGTWYSITATQANYFYTGCAVGHTFRAAATTALDANNKVKALTLSELVNPVSACPDLYMKVTVGALTAGRQAGFALRLDSPTNPTQGILCYFDGSGYLKVDQFSGATYTNILNKSKAFTAGDELILWSYGSCHKLYHRTAAGAMSTWTMDDTINTIYSGNYAGLFSTDSTNTINDITCFPVGAQGEHNIDALIPSSKRKSEVATLLIQFDDGADDVYQYGFPYMQEKGVKGTCYAVTSLIGTAGYMTWAQLLELHAAGWTIGNHTQNHTDLTTLSQADATTEINAGKTDLIAQGITDNPLHLAYPGGANNSTVQAAAAAAGMLTGRGIGSAVLGQWWAYNIYQLRKCKNFGDTLSLAQAEAWVDELIRTGDVGIALLHGLHLTTASSYTWIVSDFQAFIDYVVSKGIRVLTISEAYSIYQ